MLEFQILDLISDDLIIDDKNIFVITLYGKTENNENVVCHINNFKPFFYLRFPYHWKKNWFVISFLDHRYLNIKNLLNKSYKDDENYCEYNELYGYRVDDNNNEIKSKFLKLEFDNYDNMKKTIRIIKSFCEQTFDLSEDLNDVDIKSKEFIDLSNDNDYRGDCNLYESNINPLLRFIHFKNIKTCGWVRINNEKLVDDDHKMFNVELEYEHLNIKNIESITRSDINKYVIASFDIECDSLHGDFPNPIKEFKKLSIDITDYFKILPKLDSEIFYINFVKMCINLSKSKDNEHIHYLELENGPICDNSINNILNENSSYVKALLDSSIENSKSRDLCVNELNSLFKKFTNYKGKKIIVAGDPIIQIGTVFHKYGDDTPYDRSIVVIGPEDNMSNEQICDNIDNINVLHCKNECELLLKWKDLILKHNPDYITGYNIFGFDFDFIIKRVSKLFPCERCKFNKFTNTVNHVKKCESHAFYRLGRLMKKRNIDQYNKIDLEDTFYNKIVQTDYFNHNNKKCCTVIKNLGGNKNEDEKSFSQNTLKYINMDGRIIFDVQNEVKKCVSLDSYKLDNVSSHFMRGKIIRKLRFKNKSTRIETNNIGNLKVGDYISVSITTKYGEMKYNNGEKYPIISLSKKTIHIKGILNYYTEYGDNLVKAEWCLAKDDITPQELFNAHKNLDPIEGPKGRAKIAKYCIMDCELCIHLLLSQDFIPNNMGMASVCFVPQPYIFLRGQGIKVQSLVTKYSNDYNIRVPTLKQFNEDTDDNSGFEGAIVLEPITGLYYDPVAVLDYASLYPTSIKEKNLSHDTYFGEYSKIKNKLDNLGWK